MMRKESTYQKQLVQQRKCRSDNRERAFTLLGSRCCFCPQFNKKALVFHEIHGKYHDTRDYHRKVLQNPQDFVVLCKKCHTGVHFCMKVFGFTWEKIVKRWCLENDAG